MVKTETIILGGGCFWCIEAVFEQLVGVTEVVSGYAGGTMVNPSHEAVCSGITGHAEVVKIVFDPNVITLEQLLDVFMYVHDATLVNRQGNDVGEQYRSIILCTSQTQEQAVREYMRAAQLLSKKPIATHVGGLSAFYAAEAYHQQYYRQNPNKPYCGLVITPKIKTFRQKFKNLLKENT